MTGDGGLRVHIMEVGPLLENAYIVEHVPSRRAVVIDPGDEGEAILSEIGKLGLTVEKLLLTHGHFDHVGATGLLKEKTAGKVYIHPADVDRLKGARRQGMLFGLWVPKTPSPDVLVREGDRIAFGEGEFRVVHTPGHTPGGVSYLWGNKAFVGDLIFAGSIGRTDLPGGDYDQLIRAVREKIFVLPDDTVLFPGHGPPTTVGEEKRSNPFFTEVQGQ